MTVCHGKTNLSKSLSPVRRGQDLVTIVSATRARLAHSPAVYFGYDPPEARMLLVACCTILRSCSLMCAGHAAGASSPSLASVSNFRFSIRFDLGQCCQYI